MAPLPKKINGAQSALPVCGPPQVAREQVKGSGSSVEGWVLAPERTVLCILPQPVAVAPEGSSHRPSNGPHGFCSLTGAGDWKLGLRVERKEGTLTGVSTESPRQMTVRAACHLSVPRLKKAFKCLNWSKTPDNPVR